MALSGMAARGEVKIRRSFASVVKKWLIRFFRLNVSLLRIKDDAFGTKLRKIFLFYIISFTLVVLLAPTTVKIADFPFSRVNTKTVLEWIQDSIGIFLGFILLMFSFILFIFIRNYTLFMISVPFIWGIMIAFTHFEKYLGIWEGSVLSNLFISVVITFVFSKTLRIDIVVSSICFSVVLIAFLKDITHVTTEKVLKWFLDYRIDENTGEERNLVPVTFGLIFGNIVPIMLFLLLIWFNIRMISSWIRTIDTIGKAVLELDFSDKHIQKLLKKPKEFSTKIETLFTDLVRNLDTYLMFLPDEIKTAELGFTDRSNSSTSSTEEGLKRKESLKTMSMNTVNLDTTRIIDYTLRENEIVFLDIRISSYHKFCSTFNEKQLKSFHRDFLNQVSVVHLVNGTISHLNENNRVLCILNGVKRVVEASKNACAAALKIVDGLTESYPEVCLRVNILKSKTTAGYLSIEDQTKWFMSSAKYNNLKRFDNLNRDKYKSIIMVDDEIQTEAKYHFVFKQIGIVGMGPSNKRVRLFKLVENKKLEGKGKEWFYELTPEAIERQEVDWYQQCWNDIEKGRFEGAKKALEEYKQIVQSKGDEDIQVLEEMIRDRKLFVCI